MKTSNMKGYPFLKIFSQSLDKVYLWWTLEKSRVDHRPSGHDFSSFATEEYLDSPHLFYSKPRRVPDIRFIETNRISGIEVSRVTFPSPVQTRYRENNVVPGKLFRCRGKTPLSSLIVLHGWSRPVLNLEERLCIALAQRGITSLLLTLPYHIQRTPEDSWSGEYALSGDVLRTIDGFHQAVLEVRAIIPFLRTYSERIGLLGISLGGMIAHVVMGLEDLDFGITLLTGGNSAGIVWESIATRDVKKQIKRAGITREELSQIWAVIDPARLAGHNRVKRILMINGLYDQVIPPKFTIQLRESLGRPPIHWYPCAHISFFLFLKGIVRDITHFIQGD
ncbi:MAG: hypothetical protein JSW70_04915 [Syntrophobacterales bacterium]|nr:MAG: hypothetical protein JSW70_04915 [Syntrophobacterales bacterium]